MIKLVQKLCRNWYFPLLWTFIILALLVLPGASIPGNGLFGIKNIEFHFQYEDKENRKSNYSPEEIELVKHNINQREVTEQGSELLKFDMLEDNKKEFYLSKKQIKDSKAKKSKHYKYLFFSSKQLTKEQIDEIVEFITENNQSAK